MKEWIEIFGQVKMSRFYMAGKKTRGQRKNCRILMEFEETSIAVYNQDKPTIGI